MENKYLSKFKRDLAIKGFSSATQETYYRCIVQFLKYTKIETYLIDKEHIKDYLYYIIKERGLSETSLRQARSSIKYFFSQTIGKDLEVANIPCPKKAKTLPTVFSEEEVFQIIISASNIKHKTMFMLAYSSGLRVSEISKLKLNDIKRSNMRLAIRQAKGKQDRYTILSKVCLKQLEEYWKIYKPQEWLFTGRKGANISVRAIQHAFKKAKKNSGITRPGSMHTLRHSFATHMLESGGAIFQLQKFLGHKHLKTTLVYAHVCEEKIVAISPLDFYADKFYAFGSKH